MRRLCALLLTGALTLSPALASGQPFSDVPADAWYGEDLALCQERELLQGTGDGRFSPDGALTMAEVMTVAARLLALQNGDGWPLPQAPTDWGKGAITTLDGVKLLPFTSEGLYTDFDWHYLEDTLELYFHVDQKTLAALTPAGGEGAPAAVELNGQRVLTGTLAPSAQTPSALGLSISGPMVVFSLPLTQVGEAYRRELGLFQGATPADRWYKDALYYLRAHGLSQIPGPYFYENDPEALATRLDLAGWLHGVLMVEDMAVLNQIAALPDVTDPNVLDLYRAGILEGSDAYGSFHGSRTLTRAELAATLSRVVDPSRRLTFQLAEPSAG